MLGQLTEKLEAAFKKIRGQGKISEDNIKEMLREIRIAFLVADVNFKTTKEFIAKVREKALGQDVLTSITPGQLLVKITQDELTDLLGNSPIELVYNKPLNQIMVMGLQGSGKTTFCAKLAFSLKKNQGKNPLLVAGDVYRLAAIDQLKTLGRSVDIEVYEEDLKNPVDIAKNAQKYAEKNGFDTVIYDTAGRLEIDEKLMRELKDINRLIKPEHRFFVADATMGQSAAQVADQFNQQIDISGVVLSKMDGDSRGGAVLSVKSVTGKPIVYMGVGEKIPQLELFYPDRLASRILGMGDIISLVEKAQQVFDDQAELQLAKKIGKNKFDLFDFEQQLKAMKKMGSITDIIGVIPGMSKMKVGDVDEKKLVHISAILSSMTHKEKQSPKIIDGSRRRRIAKGSGTNLEKVNQLLKQFDQMKKMIQQMKSMKSKKGGHIRGMLKQMQGQNFKGTKF